MAQVATGADIVEVAHVAVVAFDELGQYAVVADLGKELACLVEQAVIGAVGEGPGELLWLGDVERHAQSATV